MATETVGMIVEIQHSSRDTVVVGGTVGSGGS